MKKTKTKTQDMNDETIYCYLREMKNGRYDAGNARRTDVPYHLFSSRAFQSSFVLAHERQQQTFVIARDVALKTKPH